MTIQDVEKGTREKSAVKSMMRLSRPKHPLQTAFIVTFFCCFIVLLVSLDQARKNGKSIADHCLQNFGSGRYNGSANNASLSDDGMAKTLRAQDLINRPLATDLTKAPKLFHQSWMDSELPEKFQEWCLTCRKVNSDWEWVLWTDADNRKMVEKFAPWFLQTYEDLPGEINRADAARNIYMHVFGGIYADLDTECIRSYDSLFEAQGIQTYPHQHLTDSRLPPGNETARRGAFLGRMGSDESSTQSIPNAWMGSTPGHPFWLLPLELIQKILPNGGTPEHLTGPENLHNRVSAYREEYDNGTTSKLDEYYALRGWRDLYEYQPDAMPEQFLEVRPWWDIYGYNWMEAGIAFKELCFVSTPSFDAEKCKYHLGLDRWGSHSISYWSHSWTQDGHDENRMNAMEDAVVKDHEPVGSQTGALKDGVHNGGEEKSNKDSTEEPYHKNAAVELENLIDMEAKHVSAKLEHLSNKKAEHTKAQHAERASLETDHVKRSHEDSSPVPVINNRRSKQQGREKQSKLTKSPTPQHPNTPKPTHF